MRSMNPPSCLVAALGLAHAASALPVNHGTFVGTSVTFQNVTDNGATSTNAITVGGLTVSGANASMETGRSLIFDSDGSSAVSLASDVAGLQVTGALQVDSMTTTERDALTPANGMVIYNSTTGALQLRQAGAWVTVTTS